MAFSLLQNTHYSSTVGSFYSHEPDFPHLIQTHCRRSHHARLMNVLKEREGLTELMLRRVLYIGYVKDQMKYYIV
jgi:hypothetical protein